MMHEQIWNVLAENEESEIVDTEFVYILFRILLDPANLAPEEAAQLLEEYIDKYKPRDEQPSENISFPKDEPFEKWPLLDIVKHFRKLNENRIAYTKTGYLKPDRVVDVGEVREFNVFSF